MGTRVWKFIAIVVGLSGTNVNSVWAQTPAPVTNVIQFSPSKKTASLTARAVADNTYGTKPKAGSIRITLRCFAPWQKFGSFTDAAGLREAGRTVQVLSLFKDVANRSQVKGWPGFSDSPFYGVGTMGSLADVFAQINKEKFAYHGDNRSFSANLADTARSTAFVDINLNLSTKPTASNGTSFADPSKGRFYWLLSGETERTADTTSWIDLDRLNFIGTQAEFVLSLSASNPLVPFVAPAIDWGAFVTIKKTTVGSDSYLDFQVALSGDGFPVAEVIATDSSGNSVFLRGYQVEHKRGLMKLATTAMDWFLNDVKTCGDYFTRMVSNACTNLQSLFTSPAPKSSPLTSVCGGGGEAGVSIEGKERFGGAFNHDGVLSAVVTKVGDYTTRVKMSGNNFVSAAPAYPFDPAKLKPVSKGSSFAGTANETAVCKTIAALDCNHQAIGGWENGSCKTTGCP